MSSPTPQVPQSPDPVLTIRKPLPKCPDAPLRRPSFAVSDHLARAQYAQSPTVTARVRILHDDLDTARRSDPNLPTLPAAPSPF